MPTVKDVIPERGKQVVRDLLHRHGWSKPEQFPEHADFSPQLRALVQRVIHYTMTPPERVATLVTAVEYVIRKGIPGDFVETGVNRGGSMMAVAFKLSELGVTDRTLWLYDTFDGMPDPKPADVAFDGQSMHELYSGAVGRYGQAPIGSDLDSVRRAMMSTGYPLERMHFVKGRVQETIPGQAPDRVALLRLDTDWHASTHHELVHLYPRLESGGVLIVDDYGHFRGAQKAVDDYFADDPVMLARIDYSARLAVKPSGHMAELPR